MKTIYLIQSLENSHYKIGVSNNPNKRIKSLQTGNSSELRLVCSYVTDRAFEIEKALHRKYSHLRLEGEWFKFTIENELSFVNECKTFERGMCLIDNNSDAFLY